VREQKKNEAWHPHVNDIKVIHTIKEDDRQMTGN